MRWTIETASLSSPQLEEYAAIPIAFEVTSVLKPCRGADALVDFSEEAVAQPYVKDYDAIDGGPHTWSRRFDVSQWILLLCRAEGRAVGGAAIALADVATLWDIRVAPDCRGQGIGRALLEVAATQSLARGRREMHVETQNINVPACRFYESIGFQLRTVREDVYPDCPGEMELRWVKALTSGNPPRPVR